MKAEIPIEYEKGWVNFLNCRIDLSQKTFIPRIETEYWVKKAIREIRNQKPKTKNQKLKILDMFAGSGCIGIAILRACPELCRRVDFVDIDERAIKQIKINLKLNGIPKERYRIYQSNIFGKIKKDRYDYIFANPPYAATERVGEIDPLVKKYEPPGAYLAGKRGMDYIIRFFAQAKDFLKKYGIIYLEFDPQQKKEITNILLKYKYQNFKFFKDQFKKYRYLKVKK